MAPSESEPRRPSYQVLLDAYSRVRDVYEAAPTHEHHLTLEVGATQLLLELHRPGRFALGQLVMTPGADDTLQRSRQLPLEFLLRHKHGDWSALPPEDLQENERALRDGSRLFSSYLIRTEDKLWVITEWDRSATTLLLPEEYRSDCQHTTSRCDRQPSRCTCVLVLHLHSRTHPQPKLQLFERSDERSNVRPTAHHPSIEPYPKVLFLEASLTTHFPT